MQKKFLAVLLALCLVLAFSSMALAASDTHTGDGYTATAEATGAEKLVISHIGKTGETPAYEDYYIYTDASSVTLTVNPTNGASMFNDNPLSFAPIETNVTLGGAKKELSFRVVANETTTYYRYTLKTVEASIDAKLYETAEKTYGVNADNKILVPCNETPYAKITVKIDGADSTAYQLTGAGSVLDGGFAKLSNFDDFTTEAAVSVKLGGVSFASQSFKLLRPTLSTIVFNSRANDNTNSGKKTLTAESGVYSYDTDEQVDEDWDPVYYKINPLCHEAAVTVKRESTSVTPNSSGWYSQDMSQAPYRLAVTVAVGEGTTLVEKTYYVYLMDESYKGPQVKAFYATEKDEGKGDQYLTVVDNDSRKLYVFLPKDVASFYLALDMDPNAKSLTLSGSAIEERVWYGYTNLNDKTLKVTDKAGLSYNYDVVIYHNADEHKTDASLKSLKVASGTKASTADNVNIGFDPDVLDYAFPVAKNDVYLSLNATANDSSATVFINNKKGGSLTVKDLDTAAETKFEILVVAGDNKTAQTYTVTINGSAGLLATLTASNLVGLTPAFDPAVNAYTGYTDAKTVSTVITALAKNYNSDYVQISKANYNKYGQVSSYTALTSATRGSASTTAELKTGSNIFRVDVLSSATATSAKASYYLSISVPKADPSCSVSSQKVYVNGKEHTLSAYNIAGNNYLKLRDIAALLDGTVKEMNVGWNASTWTASMAMPGTFVPTGSELTTLTAAKKYDISNQYFTYNTKPVYPLAYNVTDSNGDGYNYVKLRDIASLLNFGVTYSPTTQSIYIDTAAKYVPGL